jgi:hypothetical protein
LTEPVPTERDLMTVTFDEALLLYRVGDPVLTALLLRQIPGNP